MEYIEFNVQSVVWNIKAKHRAHSRKERQNTSGGVERNIKKQLLNSAKKNDGIAYHHHYTGHKIDFDNVQIITQEKSYWRRLIVEGMEIKQLKMQDRANLQMGYEIHECWEPILNKL